MTDSVPPDGRRVGLTIAGTKAFDPAAKSFEALANRSRGRARRASCSAPPCASGRSRAEGLACPPRPAACRSWRATDSPRSPTCSSWPAAPPTACTRRSRMCRRGRSHPPPGASRATRRGGRAFRAPCRASRGGGPGSDRALRRDAGLGAPGDPGDTGEGRHPRHLPLRPQRGHHAGQAHRPPRDRPHSSGCASPADQGATSTGSWRCRRACRAESPTGHGALVDRPASWGGRGEEERGGGEEGGGGGGVRVVGGGGEGGEGWGWEGDVG